MTKYPDTLPCPLIDGFGADIASGVLRSGLELGSARQRRTNRALVHTYQLTFVIKQVKDFGDWMTWVNANGFRWFTMKLPGALAGSHNEQIFDNTIRFIGPIQSTVIRAVDGYHWRVSVAAEFVWSAADHGQHIDTLWIIARTPANPSPDWVIARTPSNPSTDWYITHDIWDLS